MMFDCSGTHHPTPSDGQGLASDHCERRELEQLQIRLAIAQRDLRMASHRSDPNAIENSITEVNKFRRLLDLPVVPELPAHVPDCSLQEWLGELPNGTPLYRIGFGFHVDQQVHWKHPLAVFSKLGRVVQIFEYGRNPVVVFAPDVGSAYWTSPRHLEAVIAQDDINTRDTRPAESLLLMPCSGMKLSHPAAAEDLYTGVMWQTLLANGPRPACMAILSAKHGLVLPHQVIEPYELRLDLMRVQSMLEDLAPHVQIARTAVGEACIESVFVAGGKSYRQIMLAVVDQLKADGVIAMDVPVLQNAGGIGDQRAQLGTFLRRTALKARD
jgi:hypothetical protein